MFRKLTQSYFLPARLSRLDGQLADLSREFVDRMEAAGGACDFAADIAVWYPLRVVMTILGVPEEGLPLMLALTQQHFAGTDPSINKGGKADAGAAAKELATAPAWSSRASPRQTCLAAARMRWSPLIGRRARTMSP